MEDNTGHGARRAIEALRSGVPNRDVVKQLGVFQGDVTQKFTELREDTSLACQQGDERGRHMVISGGFGSGKSHLLEYLRHQALEHNCVCSYVVVSKETPLFDLTRLYRSAAETATVPGRAGRAIPEILARSDEAGLGRFAHLCEWAQNQPEYQNRFVPLLHILLESTDRDEIVN
ncbi:MAG: BREX system ATP-binding domain-containing protein, partial [Armatimonadota bacterium]